MIRKLIIPLLLSWLATEVMIAQEGLADLNFYGDIMVNATEGEHRIRAANEFNLRFKLALESGQKSTLQQLKWISHITPEDTSFDLFTWQIKESEESHIHKGYVITDQNNIIALNDTEQQDLDYPYMELTHQDWSGLLYYDIKTLDIEGEKVHILFGYDGSDQYNTIKVAESIEVMANQVLFGSKAIFEYPQQRVRPDIRNRIVLKYSEFSNLTLAYNESLGMILFDHLIARMGTVPGQGPTQISDGSYEAFAYKDGKLVYVEKVFDQISLKAPVPEPVLGKDRKETITGDKKRKAIKSRK